MNSSHWTTQPLTCRTAILSMVTLCSLTVTSEVFAGCGDYVMIQSHGSSPIQQTVGNSTIYYGNENSGEVFHQIFPAPNSEMPFHSCPGAGCSPPPPMPLSSAGTVYVQGDQWMTLKGIDPLIILETSEDIKPKHFYYHGQVTKSIFHPPRA